MKLKTFVSIVFLFLTAISAGAQTNEITYQGKLNDAGVPANDSYDMRFQVYAIVAGSQTAVGTPVERLGVTVTDGSFSVVIDLSHVITTFTGFDRFIGISVRPGGSGAPYTALLPTQKFTSTPYAIRSQNSGNASTATNATQLGGVEASQYVVTGDSRMTDARQPVPGSGDYIQNSTVAQSSSNFNISGDGTAAGTLSGNIVNATAGFNIGSTRVLSIRGTNNTLVGENAGGGVFSSGANNTLVGFAAGDVISSGSFNSFVGSSAGAANTTGIANSFFGALAGTSNTSGTQNSFFGRGAGAANTTAGGNAYFGAYSGNVSTGADNSFFGALTGLANTTGYSNSFFGADAGKANVDGHSNSFFGMRAGTATTTGDLNSFFGVNSGQNNTTGLGNSFFGANTGTATTTGNNNSFFGRSAGASNTTGTRNAFFGALAGQLNSSGYDNSFFGANAGDSVTTGWGNSFFGSSAGAANLNGVANTFVGFNAGESNTSGNANSYFGNGAGATSTGTTGNSFFGSGAGRSATGSYNSFLGWNSGYSHTSGSSNVFVGYSSGYGTLSGDRNVFIGPRAGDTNVTGSNNTIIGADADVASDGLVNATAIGADAKVYSSYEIVIGTASNIVTLNGDTNVWGELYAKDFLKLRVLGSGGTDLCLNYSDQYKVSACSSSIRYKSDVTDYTRGLDLLRQLRPVEFTWKLGGERDLGFVAEEVAASEPLLAVYKDGLIEGVKYKQITTVLVNATMEQQTEIDELKVQIEQQKQMIESLKQIVCAQNPQAAVCKEGN